MTSSVQTIRAMFQNFECKLDAIICQLEDSFASYGALQRRLCDNSLITVNPISLIEQLNKIAAELKELREEHDQMVGEKDRLNQQYNGLLNDMEEKINSTLSLLVERK